MNQPKAKKLTKRERKAVRREELNGYTPPEKTRSFAKEREDLRQLHALIVKSLNNANGLIPYLQNEDVKSRMDLELFKVDWDIMHKDITNHINPRLIDLNTQANALEEKEYTNEDGMNLFTQLTLAYNELFEHINQVIMPTQYALMENVNKAVAEMKSVLAERDATLEETLAPVSDVEFRDVPVTQ